MRIRVRAAALVLLPLMLSACGGDSKIPLAQVEGIVTLNGKPLESGAIIFESAKQRSASGKIVNGEIKELFTFDPGDGVPLGSHKVAIQSVGAVGAAVASDPSQDASSQPGYMGVSESGFPARYGNTTTSGLTAEIQKGKNTVKFELTNP